MSTYDFGVGGYDIQFDVASLSTGQEIIICSDIAITAADAATPSTAESFIHIGNSSGVYYITAKDKSSNQVDKFESNISELGTVRVVFHNQFCSVYVDDLWEYTFSFADVYHPEDPAVGLKTNGASIGFTNVRLKELSDWREAIYVDMETTTQNAFRSVILQRPVDIYPNYEGKLTFEYDPDRDSATLYFVHRHKVVETDESQGSSDGITYFAYAAVVPDLDFAEDVGFVTRMYRLPDLDTGAIRATQILQQRARQNRKRHSVVSRVNFQFEMGDIANISETLSGTGTAFSESLIIEALSFSISEGNQEMRLEGRDNA